MSAETIVILGAGMAGGVAARTLRQEGFDGRVVMIGNEPTPPFGRPPLSKTYLRGEEELSGWLVNPEGWYESNRVDRVADTATRIDAITSKVEVGAGRPIPYGKLLLTTGGTNS